MTFFSGGRRSTGTPGPESAEAGKLVARSVQRRPQILEHARADVTEVGTGEGLETGGRIPQADRSGHHRNPPERVGELARLAEVPLGERRFKLVDEAPRFPRKLARKTRHEARVRGQLRHVAKQVPIDVISLRRRR